MPPVSALLHAPGARHGGAPTVSALPRAPGARHGGAPAGSAQPCAPEARHGGVEAYPPGLLLAPPWGKHDATHARFLSRLEPPAPPAGFRPEPPPPTLRVAWNRIEFFLDKSNRGIESTGHVRHGMESQPVNHGGG
jgi:hypothetical protein